MRTTPQVTVRELKNQTTVILRRIEAGERVVVTKRGRVIATMSPSTELPAAVSDSIYRRLQRHIEARTPGLRAMSETARRAEFDRISRKIARTVPFKSWRDMDRAVKGDRFGLSR